MHESREAAGADGERVWQAIDEGLRADAGVYSRDTAAFAIETGNNYIIGACRDRLGECEGAMDCLKGLLAWDPGSRWTSEDVINSSMMECLVEGEDGSAGAMGEECAVQSFMHFMD